jgi:multiple sugar transport system substrate-binding protein
MRTHASRALRSLAALGAAVLVLASCGDDSSDIDGEEASADDDAGDEDSADASAGGEGVTLEFAQWWEPELPSGEFRALMDRFEEENPGITVELLSGPYSSTREQIVAGSATGTMSDVVGLDGAWIYDFAQQGSLADLSSLMADAGYDDAQLASQIQIGGSTYMIPVVNFIYPMFLNNDILAEAGVNEPPSTRSEFAEAAEAISQLDNVSGWVLPLSLETPNGIQNDVMAWVWASGGSMLGASVIWVSICW